MANLNAAYSSIQNNDTVDRGDLGIPFGSNPLTPRSNFEIQELPFLTSFFLNTICCLTAPISCCFGLTKVNATEDLVVEQCGIPTTILREAGLNLINPCCATTRKVNMRVNDREVRCNKANDLNGNPIEIVGQFSYRVIDHVKFLYSAADMNRYITDQAATVLRHVAGLYPFDLDSQHEECLRKPSDNIALTLKRLLQTTIDVIQPGIEIGFFKLMSVHVEEKMEKLLLARQEANAEVIARRAIAEGTTGILQETLQRLAGLGIKLTEQEQNQFATTLTLLLVNHGQTTLNLFNNTISPQNASQYMQKV